ncbi:hypothetical protein [Pararhizobium sp.]|uniref:hypothetical protein n=1 Tax=Pararhizobium sp. TaxID=1977563 RepID=UPI00271A3FF5|nr:hypothetical protein [Pararhizobium sp.]MDO9418152.1 hypothetical protein [Pararhizobium sp.]
MAQLPQLHEGHAPITLHHLFRDALDSYEDWDEGAAEPVVIFEGGVVPISAVFEHMRDCTDILPNNLVGAIKDQLSKPLSSDSSLEEMTVSTAARVMRILMRKRQLQHGGGDLASFIRRMERQRGYRLAR